MKATIAIIAIAVIVFVLQSLAPQIDYREHFPQLLKGVDKPIEFDIVTLNFALIPADAFAGSYWQFVTYMFLHGGAVHLFLNMFVLFIFGVVVEKTFGLKKYLSLYFLAGIGSGFFFILLSYILTPQAALTDMIFPMLGASGAVYGVMAAYGILYPKNWIMVIGFPMPAWIAVIALVVVEFVFGVTGLQSGVANFGHLGGLIVGGLFTLYFKYVKKEKAEPQQVTWQYM